MEKRGVPAVTVVTEIFQNLARLETQALGRPFTRLAVIPHPFGGLSKEKVIRRAEVAVAEIIKQASL